MSEPVEVVCEGCGVTFVLSERAQRRREQMAEAGESRPLYCSVCRAEARDARRSEANGERKFTGDPNEYRSPMDVKMPEPMRRGRRRGYSGGRESAEAKSGGHNGRRRGARRRNNGRVLYRATCAACGATTHVPFQPSKWQPVYCRSCHAERRGGDVSDQGQQ